MISNGFVSSGYSTRIYLVMQAMLISGKSAILITLFVGSISGYTSAFCQNSFFRRIRLNSPNLVLRESTQSNGVKSARYEKNKLLNDFKTSKGEVLNPYRILKVSRTFDKTEVKQAYRKLSKKFHPDMVRNSDIFPGNCNNMDDVMEHWERIKLAFPRGRACWDLDAKKRRAQSLG